jgi:hypothetical protein
MRGKGKKLDHSSALCCITNPPALLATLGRKPGMDTRERKEKENREKGRLEDRRDGVRLGGERTENQLLMPMPLLIDIPMLGGQERQG